MILLAFIYVYVFCVCYLNGKLIAERLFRIRFTNIFLYTAVGIMAISILARIWVLFVNISWPLQILVALPAAITAFSSKENKLWPFLKEHIVFFLAAFLFILFFCSLRSVSYDEAMYHASFIAWLNEYGLVKGLANLHGRLGFNSGWHLFASVFNFDFLLGEPFNRINGFFVLWASGYFLYEAKLYSTVRQVTAFVYPAVIVLFFPTIFVYHVIDPSADYIIIYWALILLYELYSFELKQSGDEIKLFFIVSAIFLLTIKISAIILLLPAAVLFFKGGFQKKLAAVIIAMLLVLPWLISNYILSGYLIFPQLSVSLLDPVWKVPASAAHKHMAGTKYYMFQQDGLPSFDDLSRMDRMQLYGLWWNRIKLFEKLLFAGTFLLYILLLIRPIVKKENRFYATLSYITGFTGFLFVLYNVPDFRFAAGYAFFALLAVISLFWQRSMPRWLLYTCCLCFMAGTVVLYNRFKPKVFAAEGRHAQLPVPAHYPFFLVPEYYPSDYRDSILIDGVVFYRYREHLREFNWDKNPGMYYSENNATLTDTSARNIRLLKPGHLEKGIYIP